MAINGGQVIIIGNDQVLRRLQTANIGSDVARNTVKEIGRPLPVGETFDPAEVSFEAESWDASARFEYQLAGVDYAAASNAVGLTDLLNVPLDVLAPFRISESSDSATMHVLVPGLELGEASWTFGGGDNAAQRFTFRGTELFYHYGRIRKIAKTGADVSSGQLTIDNTTDLGGANAVADSNGRYALFVSINNRRLYYETDYTDAVNAGDVVITFINQTIQSSDNIVVYVATDETSVSYTSQLNAEPLPPVLPAAVRGKNIHVYVKNSKYTSWTKLPELTSFEVRVTWPVDMDMFLGYKYKVPDRGVPEVTGTLRFKPSDAAGFFRFIQDFIMSDTTAPVYTASDLGYDQTKVLIKIEDPTTPGSYLKKIYLPKCQLTMPPLNVTADGKVEPEVNITTLATAGVDLIEIYKGTINDPA